MVSIGTPDWNTQIGEPLLVLGFNSVQLLLILNDLVLAMGAFQVRNRYDSLKALPSLSQRSSYTLFACLFQKVFNYLLGGRFVVGHMAS